MCCHSPGVMCSVPMEALCVVSSMVPLIGFEAGFETPCGSRPAWRAAVLVFNDLEMCAWPRYFALPEVT